jgi:hypothetical protein
MTADKVDVIDVDGTEVEVGERAQTTEIVRAPAEASALMRPVAPEADIVGAFHAYQNLREALLEPSDMQEAERGKFFVKKSGWRKLAVAMGVSDEIVSRTYDRDDKGRIIRAEVVVRAIAPNGRYADGLGICDHRERCCPRAYGEGCTKSHRHCEDTCTGVSHFSKSQHDIPSTAHTRAKNRAFGDLFGFGEVSAEEVTAGIGETRVPDEPAAGETVAEIMAALNAIEDKGQRRGVKMAFVRQFGQPHELMQSQVEAARRMVSSAGGKFTGTAAADDTSSRTDAPGPEAGSSVSGETVGAVGASEDETHEVSSPSPESSGSDDAPVVHSPGALEEPGPAARSVPPPAADPAAPPSNPSTKTQRGRIAMRVKELVDKQLLRAGDKAELVSILTGERASSTTQMSQDEANHMISLLAFIESDDLRVEDAEGGGRELACMTERGKDFLAPIVAALA